MIHVAVAIDHNYVQPLGVMLNSLLLNTQSAVALHLLHSDLEQKHISVLESFVAQHNNASIDFYKIDIMHLTHLPMRGHLTNAAYLVFFLPKALPSTLDKILYLDPDLLVQSDIVDLWNTELNGYLLAAVPVKCSIGERHEYILKQCPDYFNSGVMVINLEEWRREQLVEKLLSAEPGIQKYNMGKDQDVLNVITAGHFSKLPPCWNKRPDFYMNKGLSIYSENEVNEARQDVGIVHFLGSVKPWHYACAHPKRHLYEHYKKGTPWESEPLIGKNMISFISRHTPFSLNTWITRKFAHSKFASIIKGAAFNE